MTTAMLFGLSDRTARDNLEELKERWLLWLAVLITGAAGIGWTTAGAMGYLNQGRFRVCLSMFVVGVLALVARRYVPWLARILLLIGPMVSLYLAMQPPYHPLTPAFMVLLVMANAIISPWQGLASAALGSAFFFWMWPADLDRVLRHLLLIWSGAAVQWIFTAGFYTVLEWVWQSQAQANKLLEEARDRRGELRRTLDSLTEATRRLERTRHELAVARQQAEEARLVKARFAANISHELRTPLNLIIGFTEMMFRTPEVYGDVHWTPALRADVREVYRSARHLMGMVDDILDLARIEAERLPLRLEPTDLGELVQEAASTVSGLLRGKAVALETDIPEGLPPLLIDRARIRQVIINLVNNAIRFTDQGQITVAARQIDGDVEVAVSDTGVGIPAEQLAAIFEAFQQVTGPLTSSRGGIGLGLTICKQFVALHGGQIEAESAVGQGSVFRFILPLPDSDHALARVSYYAPEEWSPTVPENPLGKTALVLTRDSEAITPIVRAIEGYRTLPVDNLDELARLVESEHPAGVVLVEEPLIGPLVDPEAVWRAAHRDDLPVVRCEVPIDTLTARELGIAAYMVKPIHREELVAAIRTACPDPARALIVDDDAGFVGLLDRILRAEFPALHLRKAYSAAEALAALDVEPFDLLLLDLALEGPGSGFEVQGSGPKERVAGRGARVLGKAPEGQASDQQDAILPDPEPRTLNPALSGLDILRLVRERWGTDGPAVLIITGLSYAEEVARLRPARIEVLRRDGHHKIGRYLSALLDVAPPNYSSPAPNGGLPAPAPATQVS